LLDFKKFIFVKSKIKIFNSNKLLKFFIKKTVVFLIIIIVGTSAYAIDSDKKKKKEKKKKLPHNIEAIESKFMFRPFYSTQFTKLDISPRTLISTNKITYKPNVFGSVGFETSIKKFKFAYAFKLKPLNTDLGKTNYKNINIGIQTRIVGLKFFFLRYNGFYLKNPDDFNISGNYIRPDIKINTIGFSADFVMTKSFSINAAFTQNERQKKSAGSFMIMIGDRYTFFDSDSSIILPQQAQYYDRTKYISNVKGNTFLIAPGIGYSIIHKGFNFTPIILAGIGNQIKFYDYHLTKTTSFRFPLFFLYKNAIGYNGKKFFFNIIYSYDLNNIRFKDSNVNLKIIYWKFSLGFRII